jgi:hypothetical protein
MPFEHPSKYLITALMKLIATLYFSSLASLFRSYSASASSPISSEEETDR